MLENVAQLDWLQMAV